MRSNVNNNFRSKGLMFVISSPSGCGKTTLAKILLNTISDIKASVSVTTRTRRKGEMHGRDYYFVDEKKFKKMVDDNMLLEHAEVFGNFYGTPRTHTEDQLSKGLDVMYVIDWQGGIQLMKSTKQDVVSVFILPPSLKVLEQRLKGRGTDNIETIKRRLAKAKEEISKCYYYDYVVINDNLQKCTAPLEAILTTERLKRTRQNMEALIEAVERKD